MTCELCGGTTTVILTYSECDIVVRKRKCIRCEHFFYTQEVDMAETDAKKFITQHRKRRM